MALAEKNGQDKNPLMSITVAKSLMLALHLLCYRIRGKVAIVYMYRRFDLNAIQKCIPDTVAFGRKSRSSNSDTPGIAPNFRTKTTVLQQKENM